MEGVCKLAPHCLIMRVGEWRFQNGLSTIVALLVQLTQCLSDQSPRQAHE